jgi:hypothetical protein
LPPAGALASASPGSTPGGWLFIFFFPGSFIPFAGTGGERKHQRDSIELREVSRCRSDNEEDGCADLAELGRRQSGALKKAERAKSGSACRSKLVHHLRGASREAVEIPLQPKGKKTTGPRQLEHRRETAEGGCGCKMPHAPHIREIPGSRLELA